MADDRELVRRVCGLTVLTVAVIATAGWLFGGREQALGALAGGLVTVANFRCLHWMARLALGRPRAGSWGGLRALLWLGTSGVRFGAVAVALGIAATQGWLGLAGLLVALTALPVAVVTEGLRLARLS